MKLIYFDNPIVRSLADTPETWNQLYDSFIRTFGRTFKPVRSCYLFLEYIGFTKESLKIPAALKTPIFRHQRELVKMDVKNPVTLTSERIAFLDENLNEVVKDINAHIEGRVYALKTTFQDLVEQREKRVTNFKGAQELLKVLFGDIISFINADFDGFVKYVSRYLSWDAFCSIHPVELSPFPIRDRQLGYWLTYWEGGLELPFGKIIDDQVDYYDMRFQSQFKEFEDMVDAELHTHLILGHKVDGELRPIHALTYPPKNFHDIEARNRLALGSVTNIEISRRKTLAKHPGKLYVLDCKTHAFKEAYEPLFTISL